MEENNTTETELTVYTLKHPLWTYAAPPLICFGVIGNVLSVITLSRGKFQGMPSRVTLICLSVNDAFVLVLGLSRYWLGATLSIYVQELCSWSCKLTTTLIFASSHISSFLVAFISVERAVTICLAMRRRNFIIENYGVPLIYIFCCLINSFHLITTDLFDNDFYVNKTMPEDTPHLRVCRNDSWEASLLVDILDMFLLSIIPLCIVTIGNTAIIIKLRHNANSMKQHRQIITASPAENLPLTPNQPEPLIQVASENVLEPRRSITAFLMKCSPSPSSMKKLSLAPTGSNASARGSSSQQSRRDSKVTMTLLMVTLTFFLCNVPFAFIHIIRTLHDKTNSIEWLNAWLISYILVFANNCFNFPIYAMSNPMFRKELISLLRCR